MTNRDLGVFGETLAEQMLTAKGYQVLERNWRVREGEVDLIALDGDIAVFVEVKARIGDSHGIPEEAVDAAKQNQLLKLGQLYMSARGEQFQDQAWRIDVIGIELTSQLKVRNIRHHRDAVRFE